MACKYFVNGKWVEPFQLKKMLAEGLLDQLVENENLLVPEDFGFNPSEDLLEKLAPATLGISEVRLRIAHKANASKNTNTQKELNEDGSISPLRKERNLNEVVEEANAQIEEQNKKGKLKREKVKLLLATKVGGKVKFPNIEKEVRDKLTKELENLGANMKEGHMYMLVPSSYGYSIVPVKTSFLGQTKLAEQLKKDLKTIFETEELATVKEEIARLEKHTSKFKITIENGSVKTTHGTVDLSGRPFTETKTWKNLEELQEYILGKFDKKGNYTGEVVDNKRTQVGILAKVPLKQDGKVVLNSPGFNEELANNNFITTDLYAENGNFFHSSTFVIRALSINAETQKELNEVFEDNQQLFDDIERAARQSREGRNNPTKSDESPTYTMTVEDFESVREITFMDDESNNITVTTEMQNDKLTIVNIEKGNSKKSKNQITKAFFKRPEVVEFQNKLKKAGTAIDKKKNTLSKIEKVVAESHAFEITKEGETSYYESKDTTVERQTDANARLTGKKVGPVNERMKIGASVGNFLDILGRDILIGKIQTREEFIAAANEANKENGFTIDITEEIFNNIAQEFIGLRENLKDAGYTLITSGMFVYEYYNESLQAKTGRDAVGGTMDLVAVDKDGNVHIIDFKNMKYNEKFHNQNLYETSQYTDKETGETRTITARVEEWANQQTIYGALGTLPKYDLPVRSINALPISTTYDIAELDDSRQVIVIQEATFSSNKSEIQEGYTSDLDSSIIKLESNKKLSKDFKAELEITETTKDAKSLFAEAKPESTQAEKASAGFDPEMMAMMEAEATAADPKSAETSESPGTELDETQEGDAFDILKKAGVKGKSTGTDPGMDAAMRERTLLETEDGTMMDHAAEIAWLKKKLGDKFVGTVFNSLEDLQKYLPEQTYEMLLRARKQGKVLHGIYTGAAVHLARNAFAGTGYHEAFHVVFNLGLSQAQRLDILKETREKYADELSENPTLIEIEELLADKFMAYVQAEEAGAKSLPKKIANFFKALFRKLKLFFSPNSKVSVDELFESISLGVYKNRMNFVNTDLTTLGQGVTRFALRDSNKPAEIVYENPKHEREALEYLESKTILILNSFRDTVDDQGIPLKDLSDAELINKIGGPKALANHVLLALYADIDAYAGTPGVARLKKLMNILVQPMKGSENDYVSVQEVDLAIAEQGQFGFEKTKVIAFKQPTKLLTQYSRWLRKNGLRLGFDTLSNNLGETSFEPTEQEKINENPEEQSMEEAWGNNHATIDPRSRLSQRLKRTLNTLEKKNQDGSNKTNQLGAIERYSGREVFGYLSGTYVDPATQEEKPRLTDSYSVQEMMARLNVLKNEKPFISALISRLEDSNEGAELKKDLFIAIGAKTFQHFLHVHNKNGRYQTFYSNRKSVNNVIQDNLIGEFQVEANPIFKKISRGLGKGNINIDKINTKEAEKGLAEIKNLLVKVKTGHSLSATGGNTVANREALFKEISDTLNKYFIRVSPAEITQIWNPERKDIKGAWQNVINLMDSVESIFEDLVKGENPFEYQRPVATSVQTQRGIIEVHQSKVSKLASILKPALEKEVVASAKNVENKTVYSVQYANYLTKIFRKFKDVGQLQQLVDSYVEDPVMSNMPLLDELLTDVNLRQQLHSGVLDGLTRRGKRKGVKYSKLSDTEMTATDLALWNNQSRYKLPIPSDSATIAYIRLRKYSKEEIVQNLVKVAQGEISRILLLQDETKNGRLKKIPNYYKNGTKFQVLSFLNNRIDLNNLSENMEAELTTAIEDFLDNEFMQREIAKYQDKGVIIKQNEDGSLTFEDTVIDVDYKKKATENFKDYLYNQFYVNSQLSTILGGDPSFYKNTTDYQKRYKQVLSPGQYTIENSVDSQYNAIVFNDSIIEETKENIENIKNFIRNSNMTEDKKKEMIARWSTMKHNESDGATYISLDRYINILKSLNRYTAKHKKAAKRIRDGIEHPEDISLFPPIKPFLYTQRDVDGVIVPTEVKNSEILLTKNMADKYPKLKAVWDIMNNSEGPLKDKTEFGVVDSVIFESAIKVGAVGEVLDKDGNPRFNELIQQNDGTYTLKNESPEIITINHEDWKLQQETPNHSIDEIGNYGSQVRNLLIADLDLNSDEPIFEGKTAREIAKEYQDLIVANLRDSFNQLEHLFLDSDNEIDYETLAKELEREMAERDMEQDYFDAIELVDVIVDGVKTGKKKTALPLWHPLISMKVESLLNSFFANRITKQKINGGNMVNATSYGVSEELNWKVEEDGSITMQALLPAWSKKFFPKNSNGEISEKIFQKIKKEAPELLNIIGYRIPTEDKYSMFNFEVVGFTDSTSGGTIILPPVATTLAGLDFDIDKLFMMIPDFYIDKNGNPKYIKPLDPESTIEEIADYIINDFSATKKFIRERVESEEEAERLLQLARKKVIKKGELSKLNLTEEEVAKVNLLFSEIEKQKIKILAETKDPARKKSLEKVLDDLYGQIDDIAINIYQKDAEELSQEIQAIIKNKSIPRVELMTTAGRNNRIIEIMRTILSNPNTSKSILDPGSFDNLKEKAHYVRLTKSGNPILINSARDLKADFKADRINILEYRERLKKLVEELDTEDFNINYPSTQLELFRRNMTGAELIGIFANQNTHHAKSQHIKSFGLNYPIVFNGEEFNSLTEEFNPRGERISRSLATYLAAVVDNAKDPLASFLNMNTLTADFISMLTRVGVSEDTIFYFMNQTSILDLSKQYYLQRSNKREGQIINAMVAKWRTKLIGSELFSDIELSQISAQIANDSFHLDLSDENMDKFLSAKEEDLEGLELKEYLLHQFKSIIAFSLYKQSSDALGEVVGASKVDTKPVGPTSGYSFSIIDKQKKVSIKAQMKNAKLYGVDSFFFEDSNQKINPSFYKWGIIKPVDLMNKIFANIGNEKEGEIEYNILGQLKSFFASMKDEDFDMTDKEAYEIDTMFISFLASRLPFFNRKYSQETMKNLPDKLATFKKNNPDSEYSIFLDSLYVKDSTSSVPFRTIQYYNTGKNSLDNDYVRRVWGNMLESPNQEAKDLARELIRYTYFSSGYSFSPYSFFHLVPVKFWTDAYADVNEGIGLKNKKGQTFNQILETALEEINSGNTIYTDLILRFITQYAQNKVEKSQLLKTHGLDEKFNRPYAPVKTVAELSEDEVMIFPGKQAEKVSVTKAPQGNGQVGYIRSKVEGEKGLGQYTEDLLALVQLAKKNPKKKFYFSKNALSGGFVNNKANIDYDTARRILREIHKRYTIPENIFFPQEKKKLKSPYEVRSSAAAYLHPENKNLLIVEKNKAEHLQIIKNDGSLDFAYVFRTVDSKGNYTLWKKVTGENKDVSEDEYRVVYEKLPQLGNSIGLLEFDAFTDITESIVPNLIKGVESKGTGSFLDKQAQEAQEALEAQEAAQKQMEKGSKVSDAKTIGGVQEGAEQAPILEVTEEPTPGEFIEDAPSFGLGWTNTKSETSQTPADDLNESDFTALNPLERWSKYAKRVEEPLKFNKFKELDDAEQYQMYKCKI